MIKKLGHLPKNYRKFMGHLANNLRKFMGHLPGLVATQGIRRPRRTPNFGDEGAKVCGAGGSPEAFQIRPWRDPATSPGK